MLLPDVGRHGVGRLRFVWAVFVGAVIASIVAMILLSREMESVSEPLVGAMVGAVAIVDFGSALWLRSVGARAMLTAESNDEIRLLYARRMLLACTFAVVPVFVALVFAVVSRTVLMSVLVSVLSLVLLVVSGPRRRDIDRLDRRMIAHGRPFRVSAALDDTVQSDGFSA